MKGRTLIAAFAALLAGVGVASAEYPEKPITLTMGAAPGGGGDIQARILAEKLSSILGQQVVVENLPGAGTNIASQGLAKAAPDGYTLNMCGAAIVINHTLYANPGFDALKDFVPVAGWGTTPLMFVANPQVQASSLKELAELSKANPGTLDYGNGVGFPNHMVMELYKLESGADIQFVPYPGMAPARTDVIGGQIEVTVDSVDSAGPFVLNGQLKGLAVTAAQRIPAYPDVPTTAEAGFPQVNQMAWYGIMAPAGTPQAIVDKIAAAVAEAQRDPAVIEKMKAGGSTPMISGPAEYAKYFAAQVETWAKVINDAKIEKVQ
jgi:tripartite-type tricarboxylate transporter receptor subunit TctC